jgi:hypothetical protein
MDIITASGGTAKTITVLRNTSTPGVFTLSAKQNLTIAGNSNDYIKVITTDINSDGKPDIIVTRDGSPAGISIFRNTSVSGTISFAPRADIAANGGTISPASIAAEDFDGDGKTDLLMTDAFNGTICVLKNYSSSTTPSFAATVWLTAPAGPLYNCAATDMDGDGKPDIVINTSVASNPVIRIYKNTTTGDAISLGAGIDFPAPGASGRLTIGDVNTDGKPDVIVYHSPGGNVAGVIAVLKNNSTPGTISMLPKVEFAAPADVRELVMADVNGDAKPDLITANFSNPVRFSVLESNGTAANSSFALPVNFGSSAVARNITGLTIADFDGNGEPDVAVPNDAPSLAVFLNHAIAPVINTCVGSTNTLKANLVGYTYQWQQNNGSGFINIGNSADITGTASATLQLTNMPLSLNGSQFRCIVNGNTGTVFTVMVRSVVVPSVTITSTGTNVCKVTPPTFTATPVNGGALPTYKWMIDGHTDEVTHSNTYTPQQNQNVNGGKYTVVLVSDAACPSPATDTSNTITLSVTPSITPTVIIVPLYTYTCAGSLAVFNTITVNAGSSPTFKWYQSSQPVGTNSPTYSTNTIFGSGTDLEVVLTSSLPCPTIDPRAHWNASTVNTAPVLSISTPATTVCANGSAIFTATIANPVSINMVNTIQWKRNGSNVAAGFTYSASNILNGDIITAVLTSNVSCDNNGIYNSNAITMATTTSSAAAGISISGTTTVVAGQATVLTAVPANGGSAPTFQWQDSTEQHSWQNIAGATASTLNYTPSKTGNKVRCMLTSNLACAVPSTATSQPLAFIITSVTAIGAVPAVSYGIKWWPNPVNTIISIRQLRISDRWQTVEITAADGKQNIISQNIINQSQADVQVDQLPAGLYIAILKSKDGRMTYFKFIKI